MRKSWRRIFGTAALTFMLCLTGLVMIDEAQAQRFVDNGNGTVTDTQTGLMWTKAANLFGYKTWEDSISACSSFSISGIGGWRLPSKDELVALYHAIQGGHPFTGVESFYWSATLLAADMDYAWHVNIKFGISDTNLKHLSLLVWPVRAGQ